MKLYVGSERVLGLAKGESDILVHNDSLVLVGDSSKRSFELELEDGGRFCLEGTLHYFLENEVLSAFDGSENSKKLLTNFISNNSIQEIRDALEGHFVAFYMNSYGEAELFSDSFGREDLFYVQKKDGIVASTEVKHVKDLRESNEYDQAALANFFNVYGYYAPKKHTFYKEIKRFGVGEFLSIKNNTWEFKTTEFKPAKIKEYSKDNNEEYYKYFKSSVETRSTATGINWIYMSSGWDSSSILAMLNNIHGSSNIRCVIGRLKYSEEFGVNNNFEIERAQKLTDYFNVPLEVIDLDYCSADYLNYFDTIKGDLRSKNLFSFSAYTFYKLADFIKENGNDEDTVFNGEISDGAHNMGYSQFATILEHPDLNFREYSDKMGSYVYGPSFFKQIEKNEFKSDFIYNLLREKKALPEISIEGKSEKEWKQEYGSSFFLSPYRFPFAPLIHQGVLTKEGEKLYLGEMSEVYFDKFSSEVNSETLYSWWLHLYCSFHWQGSTVGVTLKSPASQNLKVACPFWDKRLMSFLSSMPESWGRGLDFNRTKFPLKWVLENKIDYPTHLQSGPHSYIYDVNSNWSADADFLYGSAGVENFKKILKERPYHKFLSESVFDLMAIDKLIDGYINGQKVEGFERTTLVRLVCICSVGLY